LSALARTKAINTLEGYTPAEQEACINKTIQNRWTGLFPEKTKGVQNGHSRKLSHADNIREQARRALAKMESEHTEAGNGVISTDGNIISQQSG
jgi:hypothetical protein